MQKRISKKCYVCKKTKPVSEFGKHKGRPDGLRAECKICTRMLGRKWYNENKELVKKFRRKNFIQSGGNKENRRDIKGIIKRNYPKDSYCEICCQNNKRLTYHHWDDSFPSWGIWACAGCHSGMNFLEKKELAEKYWILKKHIESTHNPDLSNVPMGVGDLKKLTL